LTRGRRKTTPELGQPHFSNGSAVPADRNAHSRINAYCLPEKSRPARGESVDNPVRKPEQQVDWVDDLYDIIHELRDRMRRYELRLKKMERKIAEEIDFELLDDEEVD
jgi:hypothetical protein